MKYVSDKRIFTAQTHKTGEIIDYSSEKEFDKQATTYQWYQSNNADANESIKETDQAGIFSLVHPGEYYCQLSNPYFPNTVLKTQNITVTGKKTQNINHNIPSSVKVNDITNIIAFSNSDLNVDFEILEGNAVINNKQLTCKQEGIVKIRLFQDGNAEYNAAELIVSIQVYKKEQTITHSIPAKVKVNDITDIVASSDSGLDVGFEIVEGNAVKNNMQLTCKQEGIVKIRLFQDGNAEYNAAELIVTIQANKKEQTITHNIPAKVKVNNITDIVASSDSGLNVVFEIVEGNAVINNKQLTCKQEGSVKIRLFQNGNAEYNASELVVSIVVDKKTQTIQINDLTTKVKVNDVITLNAIASSNLPTTYEIIEGIAEMQNNTITFQQAGTVKIKVLQVGNREYEPVEIIIEFTAEIVTGIDALNNKSVTIYPNPTPNELHFKFNDSKKRTIYFYNLEGQLLTQHNCNNSFETFTIANLPNGMIIVKVLEENEIKYYKIIKI